MADYTDSNQIVEQMAKMNISGNIIPQSWYETILFENGKPNLNAVVLLGDIVYWYRPVEIRDEITGQLTGMRKKFREDLLQRSYQDISTQFGISKWQAKAAVIALEELGVVKRVFRNLNLKGQAINNVLFLELVPEKLKAVTFPTTNSLPPMSQPIDRPPSINEHRSYNPSEIPLSVQCGTNTETTTKTNDGDYSISSYQQEEKMLKDAIGYDALIYDMPNHVNQINELVTIVVDVLTTSRETIRVNGEEKPSQVVKSQFHKLNIAHIRYVIACLSETTTEIRNIRNFIITSLYNSVQTMGHYYSAKVQHDMSEGI